MTGADVGVCEIAANDSWVGIRIVRGAVGTPVLSENVKRVVRGAAAG